MTSPIEVRLGLRRYADAVLGRSYCCDPRHRAHAATGRCSSSPVPVARSVGEPPPFISGRARRQIFLTTLPNCLPAARVVRDPVPRANVANLAEISA